MKFLSKETKMKKEVAVLNQIVNRNKLRNSGYSIDKMIDYLKEKGIKISYRG